MRQKHIPQRTCVICRQKKDKRRLTRIVRTATEGVVVDLTGKRNGRGAYICDNNACWDKGTNHPGLLAQALKTNISGDDLAGIAAHKPASVKSHSPQISNS